MRPRSVRQIPNAVIGLAFVVLVAVGSVFAYTKTVPWATGYDVRVVLGDAQNLRTTAPVRVAGVDVGEVIEIDHLGADPAQGEPAGDGEGLRPESVVVTMRLDETARPLRSDATFKLRPRLFLEGNYFIDMTPGSPSAEEVADGHMFPVNQASTSVRIGEILTTLQLDVRQGLQRTLKEFGSALMVHGGAEGFRELFRTAPDAYRYTAEVQEAFTGLEPGDLGGMVRGLTRVLRGLSANEQTLEEFVTAFRTVTGSFAAEDVALGRAVEQLSPTLTAAEPAFANLNAALPSLRAFAREALPGVRTGPATFRAARPWVAQLRQLMSPSELRGLARELEPTVPELTRLARGNTRFLEESRALSSCFNEVIIPWSNSTVQPVDPAGVYPHEPAGRTFEETMYGITGIAGESRTGDANGQWIRVMGGSGQNLVRIPNLGGLREEMVGLTPFPLLGAMPRIADSERPRFHPDEPCEEQEIPNLEAGVGSPPAQEDLGAEVQGIDALSGPGADRLRSIADVLGDPTQILDLREAGEPGRARSMFDAAQGLFDNLGVPDVDLAELLRSAR